MKKILIILSFFFLLIAISIIGYSLVSANEEVPEIKDELTVQTELEKYLTPYGYTFDNPNLILDPYGISPLTALLLFETEEEQAVTITIEGKDANSTYSNTFESTTRHYIPIYGLYPDTTNVIHIQCGKQTKTLEIKTEPLPINLIPNSVDNPTNNLYFVTSDSYPYALDNNNEVRWCLTKKYNQKIARLENGNLLLSTDIINQNNKSTGLVEINLLGKIFKQYNLDNGYYGSYVEVDNSLFILSDNLLEIDKQTGTILNTYALENIYDSVSYNHETDMLMLSNPTETIKINRTTKETATDLSRLSLAINETEVILPLYHNQKNYKIIKGIKFSTNQETKQSNQNIFLIGYKKTDDIYKNYDINITKSNDNFQITGKFNHNDEVYLILDKFLDKRVYDINSSYTIINKVGLSGKYSIYISINDTIYKTNNYIKY